MGALNPLFLVAGLAVAVPIFLHLFHRHETRRLSFPALRYLERTEREHARQIRLRQLLLLLTRVAVLLLLVGAGARLVFAGRGASHPATAVVIVLDNSMSSGLVVGETRVLDQLKELAHAALDGASDEDLFWVVRAGEPWLPASTGGVAEARAAVDETVASDAQGDLTAALGRAAELLRTSELPEREVHLLSDLQRSAFDVPGSSPVGPLPVVVWTGSEPGTPNRALAGVLVGGGLPPLEGQRTQLTVRAMESEDDTTRWPVRVVVGGRIRGAGTLSAGSETSVPLPLSGSGWVEGYADVDPDALRADDRLHFAYRSRPPPALSLEGDPGVFLTEAVAVLESSGRALLTSPGQAELLIAHAGQGLEARGSTTATLVVPPDDPTLLPALNRRLADAGIGWRYEARSGTGEAELVGEALPDALRDVRALRWFELVAVSETPAAAELAGVGGGPWAVDGLDAEGRRYLLVASPMVAAATTLPVSTSMVRFVDWALGEWAGAGAGAAPQYTTGDHLPAPADATHARFPSGKVVEIDGTRTVRGTGEAGLYTFLAADTTVAVVALNPPPGESRLARLDDRELATAIGSNVTVASRPEAWTRAVFRSRRGPELWWPFLLTAALLLFAESLLAASGRSGRRREERRPTPVETVGAVH